MLHDCAGRNEKAQSQIARIAAAAELRSAGGSGMSPEEFEEHLETYRAFVKGVFTVAALALLVLMLLAWTFSASFGMP